jgi:transcriptional regulator with XRE-family HTH domain
MNKINKNKNEQQFFKDYLASIPDAVKKYVRLSVDIASQINSSLKQKNISQRDLAVSLDKNESEISKWLSGNHNFTLKSLAKLESVLDEQLIFTREEISKRFLPYLFRQLKSYDLEKHSDRLLYIYCLPESVNKNISFYLSLNNENLVNPTVDKNQPISSDNNVAFTSNVYQHNINNAA